MSNLVITNRTISLDSTIYQVSNITSVGKYRIKPRYTFKLTHIVFFCILGFIGYFGMQELKNNPDVVFVNWFTAIVTVLAIIGILERFIKNNRYGLSIETSSGNSRLLASKDERLIDKIIKKIIEVMNNHEITANYNFNIADGDIINQKGIFENGVLMR